jgi:DNA transposition AAA+ family ATPase
VPNVPVRRTPPAPLTYDELTIDREAYHYPEPLRPLFRWLKTYVREELNRDLNRLVETGQRIGITWDKTTWTRILRARWNRDGAGQPLNSPVTSEAAFVDAIEKVQKYHTSGSARGRVKFIMTSVAQDIFSYIDIKRSPDRINRFGIIVGPTGAQKTATYKEYATVRNHGSTFWYEAPENGSCQELISGLAGKYGFSTNNNSQRCRHLLFDAVKPHHCIIIDNVQDVYQEGKSKQPAFSFLRRLQDEKGCCLILSITPTFERALLRGMIEGYFEQFEGRSGGRTSWLRLPEYPPDDDLVMIASEFGLIEADKHRTELSKIAHTPGRVRRYFEVLQTAKLYASHQKQPLTIDQVREALEG